MMCRRPLSRGVMSACLYDVGKVPDSRNSHNILLRGILRNSVISCRRERGIWSRGDELLVALRSVPISNMEGTVNTLR